MLHAASSTHDSTISHLFIARILKAMPASIHFLLPLQSNFLSQIPSKQDFRMGRAAVNHTTGQGEGKICEPQFILLLFNWKKFKLEDNCFTMVCTVWLSYKNTYIPSLESPSHAPTHSSLATLPQHKLPAPLISVLLLSILLYLIQFPVLYTVGPGRLSILFHAFSK